MYRGLVRDYEWPLLLLAVAGGCFWGLVSLSVGFSWFFVEASGMLRAALIAFSLPLHLAFWVGTTWQLSVNDPSGLVIATGGVLGFIPAITYLSVLRWREK
jgi:hypothetical protein